MSHTGGNIEAGTEFIPVNRPLKLVVLGDGACGKTSLVNNFVHESSVKEYNQTLGVEFYLKSICLPGGYNVNVQVWDIGGQALGGEMLDNYLYGSDGIMLIYDITNETSFDNLDDWLSVVRSREDDDDGGTLPRIVVVGNKCDLEHRRLVTNDRQFNFAHQHGLGSYMLSARTGEAVDECFRNTVADILGMNLAAAEAVEPQPSAVLVAEVAQETLVPSNNTTSMTTEGCDAPTEHSSIAASSYRSPLCVLQ